MSEEKIVDSFFGAGPGFGQYGVAVDIGIFDDKVAVFGDEWGV